MNNREEDCKALTQQFKDKFGKIVDIRFIDTHGYGKQYCIFKANTTAYGIIPYYKLGELYTSALWYISNLKIIPSAVITFSTISERNQWRKDETIRMYQEEMNRICSEQFETEKYDTVL